MTAINPANLDQYQGYVRRLAMTSNVDRGCAWCRQVEDDTPHGYMWCICVDPCLSKHCPMVEVEFAMPAVPLFRFQPEVHAGAIDEVAEALHEIEEAA